MKLTESCTAWLVSEDGWEVKTLNQRLINILSSVRTGSCWILIRKYSIIIRLWVGFFSDLLNSSNMTQSQAAR